MIQSSKTWLILLLLTSTLFACTDHRLGGALSPARLRLKSFSDGTSTITYTYDAQNQPSSITRNGVVSTIMYGDPQRLYAKTDTGANHIFYITPNSSVSGTGNVIIFPPVLNGTDFTAPQLLYAQNLGGIIYPGSGTGISSLSNQYTYRFDATKRLISYSEGAMSQTAFGRTFTYTGDNITGESYSSRGLRGTFTYTYDDKVNPFYGLLDPLIDPLARFSKNNLLTDVGATFPTYTYSYEYNAQNLPTKRTTMQNGATGCVTTFTYESY